MGIIPAGSVVVNDVHSRLNGTRVRGIVRPRTVDELRTTVLQASAEERPVAVAGGRHAMGGQQFLQDAVLIDVRGLDRPLAFDPQLGVVTVEAGIQWPALLAHLQHTQRGQHRQWGIYQKQTGADHLTLGGALACNAHGRGLTLGPIIQQVDAFDLLGPDGRIHTCSRTANADLFRLAIGGYGLFGIVTTVRLRLRPRIKVRRDVEVVDVSGLVERLEDRIRDGYLYGDFQFAVDDASGDFLSRGICACYQPVDDGTPLTADPIGFTPRDWARLTFDAHRHKGRAFAKYAQRYLETSGQIYWHDAQLAAGYVDDYHVALDRAVKAPVSGSEMITELYVPRASLVSFMRDAAGVLRDHRASVIYGTVRLIERDDESVLAWARDRWACVVINLHVDHTPSAVAASADTFRALIDAAIAYNGSYYLTYHRWARQDQVDACHPRIREFLAAKRRHDPAELFQSTWYRHYRGMFASDSPGIARRRPEARTGAGPARDVRRVSADPR